MDRRVHDFLAVRATGQPEPEGDIAFDVDVALERATELARRRHRHRGGRPGLGDLPPHRRIGNAARMTDRALPQRESSRLWLGILAAAVLIGTYLRLDQIAAQVLIDDEWHAVHQFITHTPREMFVDFGYADYSIPLGILGWFEAQWWGVSELTLRWPMLVCGLATLVVLPLYVAPRLGRPTAAVFALLLAMSPLLVIFTRMARPYAITLFLGWIAHGAYQRYQSSTRPRLAAGATYAVSAALATWLHPVIGAFVIAPLLWGLAQLRRARPGERRRDLLRWLTLAAATGVLTVLVVLPPLLMHPMSLASKGGADGPDLQTLIGVWYAWLGTPSTIAVVLCVALAAYGAPVVWRALPVVRTGLLGVVLTLLLVIAAGIMWSHLPVTLARYLLPFLPLLLLGAAAGSVRLAGQVIQRGAMPASAARRALALLAMALPVVLLAAQSPLAPLLRHPNSQTQHLVNYLDFRPDINPYARQFEALRCRHSGPRSHRAPQAACALRPHRSTSRVSTGMRRAGNS